MADFTYTAKRQIRAGHASGTDYTITVGLRRLDGGLPEKVGAENISLNGNVVSVLHRVDRIRPITTVPVKITGETPDAEDFDEFFSSVINGETFTFDDGTAVSAILEGNPRVQRQSLYFIYSFSIRLL